MRVPISFIVPTRNEERNVGDAIRSVIDWAAEVFILDSYSEDATVEIAQAMGAQVARRRFDNFSAQKNWALDNLQLRSEWVFFLDADERLTAALRREIAELLQSCSGCDGFYVARKNHFMGQWIRHAGMFPDWQLRLFKRGLGRYEDRVVHEHVLLKGRAGYLRNPLEHHDTKGLTRWFERHNVYTSMEAQEIIKLGPSDQRIRLRPRLLVRGPERTRLIKEIAYRYLPCRSPLVFLWMYLIRGGFLDGRIGFRYCVLKAFVDYQTSLKVLELKAAYQMSSNQEPSSSTAAPENVPEDLH